MKALEEGNYQILRIFTPYILGMPEGMPGSKDAYAHQVDTVAMVLKAMSQAGQPQVHQLEANQESEEPYASYQVLQNEVHE